MTSLRRHREPSHLRCFFSTKASDHPPRRQPARRVIGRKVVAVADEAIEEPVPVQSVGQLALVDAELTLDWMNWFMLLRTRLGIRGVVTVWAPVP